MTSLQTTQAYQVTYDYGKEGALVDALLGGDVPERRTPRKANQAQVAALPDDDDDGSFGESDDDEAEQRLQTIQQKVFSPEKAPSPVPEPSPVQEPDVPEELRQKRQQVKNYQVMLEALAPVPGVNPETIYAGINGAEVDVRDAKIIQLAKKARNYTVALASEREKNRKLSLDFERLKIDATALAKELKARGPLDPDAARYPFQENQAPAKEAPVTKASQRERRAEKRSAELRHKLETERAETDKLRRALVREVGDKLEDALANEGEGWKGRAQQIVMLKNKVRRLEREVSEAGVRKRPPRRDVDAVAQRELEEARKEREREIQEVFEQKESLQREVFKVKETLQASQARVVAQTQEVQRNKDHIKSLLEKGDGDDELVDALRREVAALKDGLRERDAKIKVLEREKSTVRVARGGKTKTTQQSGTQQDVARLERDNARLQKQVEHQAEQLKKRRRPDKAPVYAGPEPVIKPATPPRVERPATPPQELSFAERWAGAGDDADMRRPGGSPPPQPLLPRDDDAAGVFSPSRTLPARPSGVDRGPQSSLDAPRGRRAAPRNDDGAGIFSPSRLPPQPDVAQRAEAAAFEELRAERRREATLRRLVDAEANAQAQREEEERLWRADAARRPATPEGWTPPADAGESDGWSD